MAAPIRLQRQHLADLKTLTGVDVETLRKIILHLQALSPSPLQPKELRKEITPLVPEQSIADTLVRQLLGLYAVMSQLGVNVDEFISGLSAGIESSKPPWTSEELHNWTERAPVLRELLLTDAIRVVAKVLDLSYEYANVLQTGRIITDVRPVFKSDAMSIEAAIISHKLFIRYWNVEGRKTFTMTLDEEDVTELKKQCERALLKAKTISTQLTKGSAVRTIVPGEDETDRS